MIIYNITIKVNAAILNEWMKWQQEEHIPDIMSTNLFEEYKIFRLLDLDDTDGITYVFHYYANSKKSYDTYIKEFAPGLREKALEKWGNGFIAFRSVMQSVQ